MGFIESEESWRSCFGEAGWVGQENPGLFPFSLLAKQDQIVGFYATEYYSSTSPKSTCEDKE
jgi:hypothetical protein